MKNSFARWMIGYGLFLVLAGVAGFLSNPEKAKTALISGGTFGGLAVLLGVLAQRGASWPLRAGRGLAVLLSVVFAWRAAMSWMAVAAGNSDKLFAAVLITSMEIVSVVTIVVAGRALSRRLPPPGES